MVQAILFDLDSVLPDLDLHIRAAVQEVLLQLELPQATVKKQAWSSGELQQYVKSLNKELNVPLVKIQTAIAEHFFRHIKANRKIEAAFPSLCTDIRQAEIPVICVTTRAQNDVLTLLQWSEQRETASQSALQIQLWQKDVESYQKVVTKAGLVTEESLFFGASLEAVRVASNAGSMVIAFSEKSEGEKFISAGAVATIHSLTELGTFSTIAEFQRNSKRLVARQAAYVSRINAYTPYSNFKVGAAIVSGKSGKIYAGCNVENSSYGATICAERGAVMKAVAAEGDLSIDAVVIVSDDSPPAVPCAMCLQVFAEFSHPKTEFSLYDLAGVGRHFYFDELLPHPFLLGDKRELLLE